MDSSVRQLRPVLSPFTDCMVPVSVPSKAGTVLMPPAGVHMHELVAMPVFYEAKNDQFMLHLNNANETPVRLESATRVLDCEITPLPLVDLDTPVPMLGTFVRPAPILNSPSAPMNGSPLVDSCSTS